MSKFYVPTKSPEAWRALLADPEKHWRDGYSAKMLAECWETAGGFPNAVGSVLRASSAFADLEPLLAIPEHQVPLPGGRRPSHNDIFVLARTRHGLVSVAVEGKVDEPFDRLVSEWLSDAGEGKRERLRFLVDLLGLGEEVALGCRYQLLHRTASAVLLAQQFHARDAVMLVHSFSATREWLGDYQAFARALGAVADADVLATVGERGGVRLHLAWVSDR